MMVTGIFSILINEKLKDKAAFLEGSLMGAKNRLKTKFFSWQDLEGANHE